MNWKRYRLIADYFDLVVVIAIGGFVLSSLLFTAMCWQNSGEGECLDGRKGGNPHYDFRWSTLTADAYGLSFTAPKPAGQSHYFKWTS